jgi:hypothetical protein
MILISNMETYVFILLVGFTGCLFIPAGVLLHLRSHHKPIRTRSPALLLTTHWSNTISTILSIIELYFQISRMESSHFRGMFMGLIVFFHYLCYFPYILRCYRLYYIFNLDKYWDEQDSYFRRHIYRTKQSWLIKQLFVYMLAVVVLLFMTTAVKSIKKYMPSSREDSETVERISASILIIICFIEEMLFIVSVYLLRNVDDDYNMGNELVLVCFLWSSCSFFSIYRNEIWVYSGIVRNFCILIVSTMMPLAKSFTYTAFGESLTFEILQTLQLVLQHHVSLDKFEQFLTREGDIKNSRSSTDLVQNRGLEYLNFWIRCENLKFEFDRAKLAEIYNEYFTSENSAIEFPQDLEDEVHTIYNDERDIEVIFNSCQEHVFQILNTQYFPKFKKSTEYDLLVHDVAKDNIYTQRINLTSLVGIDYLVPTELTSKQKKRRLSINNSVFSL